MTIAIRTAIPGDRVFLIDSWLTSYRTSHTAGLVPVADFHRVHWPVVESLLSRPDLRVLVAYETEAERGVADLYGFLAFEPGPRPLVLYVYVKEAARRGGVARALFDAASIDPLKPFDYACKTGVVAQLIADKKLPYAKPSQRHRYPKERNAA